MTNDFDNDRLNTDASFDADFGPRIADAFDRISPDAAAEERMLAAIMQAQREHTNAHDNNGLTERPAVAGTTTPFPAARKRTAPWKVALPIAASIVLVAGIGLFALGNMNDAKDLATEAAYETEAASVMSEEAAPAEPTPSPDTGASTDSVQAAGVEGVETEEAPAKDTPTEEAVEEAAEDTADSDAVAQPKNCTLDLIDGRTIEIIEHDGVFEPADEQFLGAPIQHTTCWSDDPAYNDVGATVFEYADGFFAVQFDDDPAYYLGVKQS